MAVGTSDDVVRVRQAVRARAVEAGFGIIDQTKLVTAASEIARNTVDYGSVAHRDRTRRGAPRRSTDLLRQWARHCRYQGSDDRRFYNYRPTRARPQRVKCLSNEFSIESAPGKGTTVHPMQSQVKGTGLVWPAISGQLSATRFCSLSSA